MEKWEFINELSKEIERRQEGTVKALTIEMARHVPESSYQDILHLFKNAYRKKSDIKEEDLLEAVQQVMKRVEGGYYKFEWDFEGDYGYLSDEFENLYDQNGLGSVIEPIFITVMNCVENGRYEIAYQAFEEIMSIAVANDYGDDIDIEMMFDHDFINLDYGSVLDHYAYTMLMLLKGNERTIKLLEIIRPIERDFSLNQVVSIGNEEIPEKMVFAEQWVELLSKRDYEYKSMSILVDALLYKGGTEALEQFVLEFGVKYQQTYIELIKIYMIEEEYQSAIKIAQHGLCNLNQVDSNRMKIADLLEELGRITNDPNCIEEGIKEGFHASIDLKHFMKLYTLNSQRVLAESVNYLDKHKTKKDGDFCYIHFLNGDYDLVWNICSKDKNALGWSSSVKGEVLPLFIALLSGKKDFDFCIKKLLKRKFWNDDDAEGFLELFGSNIRELSEDEYSKYLGWCKAEIDNRAEAIIRGQFRGSYYKVSSLVVSMGEVMASRGDRNEAIQYIKSYKQKYPRHTAFHGCLREDLTGSIFGVIF